MQGDRRLLRRPLLPGEPDRQSGRTNGANGKRQDLTPPGPELCEVLEEWLILKLRDHDPIPIVDGLDLGIAESEAA